MRCFTVVTSLLTAVSQFKLRDSLVLHCTSVLCIRQGNWQRFKMATFCAEKLARKKNSRFQSTALKSRTESFLDSKRKSRVIALLMLQKCHLSLSAKAKQCYQGGMLLRSVCFPKSLLMVLTILEVLYSCQTVGRKLYLDLVAFSITPYRKAFTKRVPGDLLVRSDK